MLKRKILISMIATIVATSSVQVMATENNVNNYSKAKGTILKTGVVNSNSGLNVRTSPKVEEGNKIFAIENNTEVSIIEENEDWYKIIVNNREGWVNSKYVEVKTKFLYVDTSSLNFREEPTTSSKILSVLLNGARVELLSYENEWVKVKYQDKIGFVHGKYVVENLENKDEPGNLGPAGDAYDKQEKIVSVAINQIGKPYVWAAEGPDSFDCSGLIRYVYKSVGLNLPRTADGQSNVGANIERAELKKGDLIFSSTDGSGSVNHVGIYIGDGYMIHAPKPGDKVSKTSINSDYWKSTYLWAKRVI